MGLAKYLSAHGLIWQRSPEDTTGLALVVLSYAAYHHTTTLFHLVDGEINVWLRLTTEDEQDETFWTKVSHSSLYHSLYANRLCQFTQSIAAYVERSYPSDKQASLTLQTFLSRINFRASEFRLRHEMLHKLAVSKLEALHMQDNKSSSAGVTRLTLLAAIFLPASLSSSLLAMSTRFKDLNLLLYDFIGVFFLLGALALFAYGAVIAGTRIRATVKIATKLGLGKRQFTFMIFLVVTPAVIITTTFLIGMFWDARNGGIALATGLALYIVLVIGVWCCVYIWAALYLGV